MAGRTRTERHRIAIGLFLMGIIFLGFWWYVQHQKNICELSGGAWEKFGANKVERCNPKTTDAGKRCTDTAQCQGACFVTSPNATYGFCSEYRYFSGCFDGMYQGKVSGLCWK